MNRPYAVTQYWLPEYDGFDVTISRLLHQIRGGHGAMIHRSDGISLRLFAEGPPADSFLPAIWEPREAVLCWLCGGAWPAGYVGFDNQARIAAVVCEDCADTLAAMVVDRHNAGTVGG